MQFSFEIKGLDLLREKLKKLPGVTKEAIHDGEEDVMDQAEAYAVEELQKSIKYSTGELTRSLRTEVKLKSTGEIVGRLWSNDPIAVYREFGTGRNGERSPKIIPPNVTLTYRQTTWFIPVDKVDLDLTAIYGMQKIKIHDKEFYRTNGQPARQFLTPAIEKAGRDADEIISKRIKEALNENL